MESNKKVTDTVEEIDPVLMTENVVTGVPVVNDHTVAKETIEIDAIKTGITQIHT